MPETKEYTIYTFDELTDRAKERARDWWRSCEDSDFDTDFLYEDFQRMADILGITFDTRRVQLMGGGTRYDPKIYWSGFSSQGDGACFEGSYRYAKGAVKTMKKETNDAELIRIAQALQDAQAKNFYSLRASMAQRGHYNHSGCMTVSVEDNRDSWRDVAQEDDIVQAMRDFADWMYRQLEKEYEYRMSDENVDESIRINEYTFDEDGKRED